MTAVGQHPVKNLRAARAVSSGSRPLAELFPPQARQAQSKSGHAVPRGLLRHDRNDCRIALRRRPPESNNGPLPATTIRFP